MSMTVTVVLTVTGGDEEIIRVAREDTAMSPSHKHLDEVVVVAQEMVQALCEEAGGIGRERLEQFLEAHKRAQ